MRGIGRLRKWRRKIRAWWRQWRGMAGKGTLILCYHRVADLPHSPRRLWVSPQQFAEQMEVLANKFMPISLSELAKRMEAGRVSDKTVVVTFDDGYADNFWNARPILERFGVPATVFVATSLVGTKREFYWDELERLLLCQETPPEVILVLDEREHRWKLTTPEERLRVYHQLCDLLTPMAPEEREALLEQLRQHLKAGSDGRTTYRLMTVDELHEISRDGLVDIGAHTVHHPDLTTLPLERQRWEIVESKRQIELWLQRPTRWFAYPYGRSNAVTKQLVREAGFELACAVILGAVRNDTDPFYLPRFFVENWDGDTFERRLWEVF